MTDRDLIKECAAFLEVPAPVVNRLAWIRIKRIIAGVRRQLTYPCILKGKQANWEVRMTLTDNDLWELHQTPFAEVFPLDREAWRMRNRALWLERHLKRRIA